jgi:hypothetical protein
MIFPISGCPPSSDYAPCQAGTRPTVRWTLGPSRESAGGGGTSSASQADSEGSIPFTRSNFRAASSLNSFRCLGYVGHFIEAEEFDRSLGRGHIVLQMLAIHLHLPKFARFESPPSSAWEAEVRPLDDTRKMPGFRRFYNLTV